MRTGRKQVVAGSTGFEEKITEMPGKTGSDFSEKRLMHSVLQSDKETIKEGKIIMDAINQGFFSINPSLLFEQMVKNFSLAKQIIGESLIRQISGYDAAYIEKNIRFPEFRRELQQKIEAQVRQMKENGLIKAEEFTEKAIELASIVMYTEELDRLKAAGLGERTQKMPNEYGLRDDVRPFRHDRYRNIALKKTVKTALRRGHSKIEREDIMSFERKDKSSCCVVYALDASGSMKGKKLEKCKKAGIALAYAAIKEKNDVGLIVFKENVKKNVEPTQKFLLILKEITSVRAANETNIASTMQKASEMMKSKKAAKHLVLITDALPTAGKEPEKETLSAAAEANSAGITISVVGIALDKKGEGVGKKIAEIGKGRLYIAKSIDEIDKLVLEDYYHASAM